MLASPWIFDLLLSDAFLFDGGVSGGQTHPSTNRIQGGPRAGFSAGHTQYSLEHGPGFWQEEMAR